MASGPDPDILGIRFQDPHDAALRKKGTKIVNSWSFCAVAAGKVREFSVAKVPMWCYYHTESGLGMRAGCILYIYPQLISQYIFPKFMQPDYLSLYLASNYYSLVKNP